MAKGAPPSGGFTRLGLTGTTAVPYAFTAKASATADPGGPLSQLVRLSASRLGRLRSSELVRLSPSVLQFPRRQS